MTGKVAIVGAGNVGSALAEGLARAGYEVKAVGKEPAKVREVAEWAENIILAVPYAERRSALDEMGEAARGKVLVDVTNAVTRDEGFVGSLEKSGAEDLQGMAGDAKVVKAFNTVFAGNMATGRARGERLSTFLAGDDARAKERVARMARDLGFDAVDTGNLQNARWLEALGYLNIVLGFDQGLGTGIGFRLVHEEEAAAGGRTEEAPQRR